MKADLDTVERSLAVGRAVIMCESDDTDGTGRVRGFIRGWQRGAYILLDIPDVKGSTFPFRVNVACVLRFISDGDACACSTAILDLGSGSHFSYLRVYWPSVIESIRVRRHGRAPVSCSCTVKLPEGREIEGELQDISAGGCRIVLKHSLPKDMPISLTFDLPDGSVVRGLASTVASIAQVGNGVAHGIQFSDPDECVVNDIEFFVASTLARLRGVEHEQPRILLITQDARNAGDLKMSLKDRNYDVTLAVGVVDGFFSLRLARPSALVVALASEGTCSADICRYVRETRQFAELPIVVYGGGSGEEKQVMEAGATKWFPQTTSVRDVCAALEVLVPHTADGEHAAFSRNGN
ncbi:MAG: PilZ domain-containing protein [Candidatus Hydrogenedentes bacterium]|nr:PilZ domain-containing protein [Candidatus Hydrogenedentota bacterium]